MQQLLPGTEDAAPQQGLMLLEGAKASWKPSVQQLRAASYPTPFAQAELMAELLGQLELGANSPQRRPELENPHLPQTFERWRRLLLGVVLGVLELEQLELSAAKLRKFGATLARLRPELPELTLLRAPWERGGEQQPSVMGASDPRCLFWCSPRHEGLWTELRRRVDGHPQLPDALRLLADFRAALRREGRWKLTEKQIPPWMRALELVLLGVEDSGGEKLREDSRSSLPLRLELQAGRPLELLYLPILDPGHRKRMLSLLFMEPESLPGEAGWVGLKDSQQKLVAKVQVAPLAGTELPPLLDGVGNVQVLASSWEPQGRGLWLDDRDKAPGLRRRVFEPILRAAAQSHNRSSVDREDLEALPVQYPWFLRLLLGREAQAQEGHTVRLSAYCLAKIKAEKELPWLAQRPSTWTLGAPAPACIALPNSPGAPAWALVEHLGEGASRKDLGELRALGFGLWLVFVGEAALRVDATTVVWSAEDEQELLGRCVQQGEVQTLGLFRSLLEVVHAEATAELLRHRLASFQRLLKAVGEYYAHEKPQDDGAALAALAVTVLARWAFGDSLMVKPAGQIRGAPVAALPLSPDSSLPLFLDAFARAPGTD